MLPFSSLKIYVRVKTPSGEYRVRKRVEKDGKTVIMRRARAKVGSWSFTIDEDSIYLVKNFWGQLKPFVDVFYGSMKTCKIDWTKQEIIPAIFDLDQEKKVVTNDVLDRYGKPKEKISLIEILIIGGLIVNIGLTLLIASNSGVF